jgi:hypothetical protein
LMSEVMKGNEILATDEILNEVTIDKTDKKAAKEQLTDILNVLLRHKKIVHPKDEITLIKVDKPVIELQKALNKSLLDPIMRLTSCDEGEKSLIYLRREFTPKTISGMTKKNPILKDVDFKSLPDIRKKMTGQLNKLGIQYEDLTEQTELWKSKLTAHEHRVLSGKIQEIQKVISKKNVKINADVDAFIAYQLILDTKIAVLCLAIAGVIGGIWDIVY